MAAVVVAARATRTAVVVVARAAVVTSRCTVWVPGRYSAGICSSAVTFAGRRGRTGRDTPVAAAEPPKPLPPRSMPSKQAPPSPPSPPPPPPSSPQQLKPSPATTPAPPQSTGGPPRQTAAERTEALVKSLVAPERSVRLDNLLAQAGIAARRDARQFCRQFEVTMVGADGRSATPVLTGATKVDPARLRIDGEPVEHAGRPLHLLMHKPAGYVCSHADDEGASVYDLLPRSFNMRRPPLASIGRLDRDATGLLLFTQNGALNARLTSPRRACAKDYLVSLAAPLSATGMEAAALAAGRLALADGSIAKPATLRRHPTLPNVARVTLSEGRYHQLRRMFAALGHTVTGIHRVGFGGLWLPPTATLAPGAWRFLTPAELTTLLEGSAVTSPPPRAASESARMRASARDAAGDYADVDDLNAAVADVDDYVDVAGGGDDGAAPVK